MSLPDRHSAKTAVPTSERRKYPRRKPRQLVYIDVGQNNGGFVLDVSEGGVCFQGVASLDDGEIVKVRFKLPGTSISIRAEAQFVRAGSSEKGGALKFVNIPSEVQIQLREWIGLTGQAAASPNGEADVVSLLSATANNAGEAVPTGRDRASRFSAILAQAIAKSAEKSDSANLAANPRPDALARRNRSNTPEPAASENTPPMAGAIPIASAAEPAQPGGPNVELVTGLTKTRSFYPLAVNPTTRAANESITSVRDAVLFGAAKQQRAAKGSHASNFAAGIVVGCVVLATLGGGLVATGRLRLVKPSAAAAITANAAPAVSNADANAVDVGSQNPAISGPAPNGPAAATAAETPAASSPAAVPATPPAAPVRNDAVRSASARNPVVRDQGSEKPAATQQKSLNAQRPAPVTEVATPVPAEAARESETSGSIQLGMSRPVEQAQSVPVRAVAPAPSVPTGVSQSLPELGSQSAAAISQTSTPSAAPEAFASPQVEERPTRTQRTDHVSQRSTPVFASPDSNGAKPSSVEPAMLVLYVEPTYPAAARAAKIQGSVDVLATIGKDGVPRSLQVANGDPQLAAAAIAAISSWRYRPAILNGQFEESLITITVKFAL